MVNIILAIQNKIEKGRFIFLKHNKEIPLRS
jgi:hypothetical protein